MQQHGCKYFARRPPSSDPGWVQKFKIIFSEQGHVAYQIKWNYECGNMVASTLPVDAPLLTLGVGSKGQNSTFSEYGPVAYQMKGNDTCNNTVANILPTDPHPRP